MVDPFCFVLKSRLAGIAGRNKPLINMKAHLQRCAFGFAFIWFRVQGSCGGFAAFGERPRRRRRIECLEEAQLYAAV